LDADTTATPAAGNNLDIPDNKSEDGTTASPDAQTAGSTLEGDSTIESTDGDMSVQESCSGANIYKSRVQARHDAIRTSMPSYSSAQKYTFNSVYSIPQNSVQTHAIASPPCSSHLFTGGSDGYVRRYAWYASLRDYPSERHPVLRGYWENLSITAIQARGLLWNLSMQEDPSRIRFGPAGIAGGTTVPVHSLAVQRDEMYCLAGSAEGVINLYSVRLDEGQCRACLGITGKGHKRNSPISALALSERDATLLSGSWDKRILVGMPHCIFSMLRKLTIKYCTSNGI
jgi:transcriptional activator SPT8